MKLRKLRKRVQRNMYSVMSNALSRFIDEYYFGPDVKDTGPEWGSTIKVMFNETASVHQKA